MAVDRPPGACSRRRFLGAAVGAVTAVPFTSSKASS